MLKYVCPKLPMRNKNSIITYYKKLGFVVIGDYEGYLMITKDEIEIHFFEFKDLIPLENYGQVYIRVKDIEVFYDFLLANDIPIHPNGALQNKPWKQKEFSLLDPDGNLLTFGEDLN
ncbi:bleomycin resistance protein [Pedobacter alpinus]|uniref:Bleomycin resistance protein n=1 Tax=Pedobacter alpinus TaxID=1590643 RepID=A0ABW5TU05_9SPHI